MLISVPVNVNRYIYFFYIPASRQDQSPVAGVDRILSNPHDMLNPPRPLLRVRRLVEQ